MRPIVTAVPVAPLALTGVAAAPADAASEAFSVDLFGYQFHRHWTGRREVTGSRRPRWPNGPRDRTS
ncbi:hypothetical protein [Actinoallomurus iriomotensis]|uniref:Uncharacterized protein n=1 Tax=Actinoallomurus iriomotensis TaxID=478107 RepID=A0A9W6S8D7_9ACTN|nr:hypothetical protein [Actinoallomurus iriomotensis]GLY89041.1 hypothetical protein Airi02_069700 [Actinoallomurus iriomotensis]